MSHAASLVFRSVVSPSKTVKMPRIRASKLIDRQWRPGDAQSAWLSLTTAAPETNHQRRTYLMFKQLATLKCSIILKIRSDLTAFYIPDTNRC